MSMIMPELMLWNLFIFVFLIPLAKYRELQIGWLMPVISIMLMFLGINPDNYSPQTFGIIFP